jgi:hypothetical protein
MINKDSMLAEFFEQEIFDLDDDEIEEYLCDYSEGDVNENIIARLQLASLTRDEVEEVSWKLGRVFGGQRKLNVDCVVISKLPEYSSDMVIACMNFLSGYWDEAKPDLVCLKTFLRFVSESVDSNRWSQKLSALSVEAVATLYGNNKSIFLQDSELIDLLGIVRSYAENNIVESPGKSLLARM